MVENASCVSANDLVYVHLFPVVRSKMYPCTCLQHSVICHVTMLCSCRKEVTVHLSSVPSCKELTRLLHSQFIMTMATSSNDEPIIKMFFYAQHVCFYSCICYLVVVLRRCLCVDLCRSQLDICSSWR